MQHSFEWLHNCQGPDNRLGNCVDIRDCDSILKRLTDMEPLKTQITEFLRNSNEICKSHGFTTGQKVCCPIGRATVSDIPQSPHVGVAEQNKQPIFSQQPQAPPLLHGPPARVAEQNQQPQSPPLLHGPPARVTEQNQQPSFSQQPLLPSPIRPLPVIPLDDRSFPECGVAKQQNFLKLIAGQEAPAETWPWVAAIGYFSNGEPQFNCAGTLISDRHILTSAQCVTPDMSFVKLGTLNINSTEGTNVPIEKGLIHGDYNSNTLQNDIAIIVLTEKLTFTDAIRPICLPINKELQEKEFSGYTPFTAGWRTNRRNTTRTESVLRHFQTTIFSNSECKARYINLFPVDDKFICAGNTNEPFLAGIGGSLMYPEVNIFYSLKIFFFFYF